MGALELLILLGLLGMVLVGSVHKARQNHLKKQIEHVERMKLLEMGLVPQPSGLDWPAAAVCMAIGAGVPIGSFVVTWLASLSSQVPEAIWFAPVVVSLAAIGSTRQLILRLVNPDRNPRIARSPIASRAVEKPMFDPEAFDVVGSRG